MYMVDFLQQRKIKFEVVHHKPASDPQQVADVLKIPRQHVARTVLLRADHGFEYLLVIVPSNCQVDLVELSTLLSDAQLEMATEQQVAERFPDSPHQALPPFGSQFGCKSILDERLTECPEIVFPENGRTQCIRLRLQDFRAVEEPLVLRCAKERKTE